MSETPAFRSCLDNLALQASLGREYGPIVDVHAHLLCEHVETLLSSRPELDAHRQLQYRHLGEISASYNAAMMTGLRDRLADPAVRLHDMDRMGVDVQVLSPSPTQYYYWADRQLAQTIVAAQNEHIAQACQAHPKRFVGLAALAMQFPDLAASQLKDAVLCLGLRGAEISTRIGEKDLSHPDFDQFWQTAEQLRAAIFIHPLGCSLGERIAPWYLSNVIGQPLETTIALSNLIFGGVFDRFPNLIVCAAHGGGYLPHYLGRSDHAWQARPEARTCAHLPSSYMQRIHYDALVYDAASLERLVSIVGASQVLLGTDYPFDMGAYEVERLLQQSRLTRAELSRILGGNAIELFGIEITGRPVPCL